MRFSDVTASQLVVFLELPYTPNYSIKMKNFLLALVMLVAVGVAAAGIIIHCPAEVNVRCPALGSMAVHLPHPHYCSKYCECVGEGLAYMFTCPHPLLWDDTINTCNWPDNVSACDLHFLIFVQLTHCYSHIVP